MLTIARGELIQIFRNRLVLVTALVLPAALSAFFITKHDVFTEVGSLGYLGFYLAGSVFATPTSSGQASTSSMNESLSRSGGGGQPCFFGSSLGMPGTVTHASTSSMMPSLSVSFGGGQPCFFGSTLGRPGSSGQASLSSGIPS